MTPASEGPTMFMPGTVEWHAAQRVNTCLPAVASPAACAADARRQNRQIAAALRVAIFHEADRMCELLVSARFGSLGAAASFTWIFVGGGHQNTCPSRISAPRRITFRGRDPVSNFRGS